MDAPPCPACGGPGYALGALGRLLWFRCRNCGSDFHATDWDEQEEDEATDWWLGEEPI